MAHKFAAAALAALLLFTAAGCGSNAGTNAAGWNRDAAERNGDSRWSTTGDDAWNYRADDAGRVDGYPDRSGADTGLRRGEQDLKNAGEDLANAARDAGESVGHAAEGAMDAAENGLDRMTH